jgi:uncharacterized repeat protein (TIGR03803 family)
MRTLREITWVALFLAATAAASPAQTFNSLFSFDGTNGEYPFAALVQATNGYLYGTTNTGGTGYGFGTVFQMTPSGTLTTLYTFCANSFTCSDGQTPSNGALVQATNGDLYGTTTSGGVNSYGTVFSITPSGTLTTLWSFCSLSNCPDGNSPTAGLVQATNGDLYGTTPYGGAANAGVLFKITPGGALTTLYNFCSQPGCADGSLPLAPLVLATNGDLYGTTSAGGSTNGGTVFKITPGGTLTTLHMFCNSDSCAIIEGAGPAAALIQANNGDFYGTTVSGGAHNYGTVFSITPSGTLTTLYNFCSQTNCADGTNPWGGLVQAPNGEFYGTTQEGGDNNNGTVFNITASGTLTTLYSFTGTGCGEGASGCPDGQWPYAGLVQDTNGKLYGATRFGGTNECSSGGDNCGTIFSLSGLGPFARLASRTGKEGASIGILGQGFSSSSVVKFAGVAAVSTTRESSFISATVPAGALTGPVTVTTGATTLTSNNAFLVTPTFASFNPPSGPVGTPVVLTGTGLTQTTKVTFGGVAATIVSVNSDTQVTANVPTGAVTGKIVITTKGGAAESPTNFTVN